MASRSAPGGAQTVDVGQTLDEGPWTAMQRVVVLLAAISIVLDGFDGQMIGFAIPAILKEWNVTREAFSGVVAAGLIGMAVGSAVAGLLGDRLGRRRAIIGSVVVFGLGTMAIGFAQDVTTLAVLRFLTGLGIGGCLPSATTLAAEYTPARLRTMAVTATIVCVPLGGMLAGLFAGEILPVYGWRALFLIGGLPPLAMAAILAFTLPESPRWLARHPKRWGELARLLGRMGRPAPEGAAFIDAAEQKVERRGGVAALFQEGRASTTVALWFAFFLCLLTVYTAFSWLPTLLTTHGYSAAVGGRGLTAYNMGGVFGALILAAAIGRFGSRWPLIACAAGAAGTALWLRGSIDTLPEQSLITLLGFHGFFVNAAQSTLYAVCAYVYTTNVRATGTAAALAVGRFGAILSAFAGAWVIGLGGGAAVFGMLTLSMVGCMTALALVKRHIPPRRLLGAAPPV